MTVPRHRVRFYDFGRFRVDTARRLLLREQTVVSLPAKAFDLLTLLLEERDRALRRTELLAALWPDVTVEDGNLSVNVSMLRKALRDDAATSYIETLPRVGYRFSGNVLAHSGEQGPAQVASRPS